MKNHKFNKNFNKIRNLSNSLPNLDQKYLLKERNRIFLRNQNKKNLDLKNKQKNILDKLNKKIKNGEYSFIKKKEDISKSQFNKIH